MKKYRTAFNQQRVNASKRGIDFQFSYEEWIAWWLKHLGAAWFEKRGCRRGQYVMARRGDAGPYHISNVDCITVTENHKSQIVNGKCGFVKGHKIRSKGGGRPPKLTPNQRSEIAVACGTQKAIAAQFGVSERLVRTIKKQLAA